MNLHEYQAKQLLAQHGIPVPKFDVANDIDNALRIADTLTTGKWVVKAQIHAGGRGKAGGVKLVNNKEELKKVVTDLLGKQLITYQTTELGQPVNAVMIEEPSDIEKELYLGAVIDRSQQQVVFMASTEGGVDIEKVAHETPDKIIKINMDPLLGILPYQCRHLGFQFKFNDTQIKQLVHMMTTLGKLFVTYDFSLLEINPLVINKQGNLVCLDAKINIDDNALFRQPKLSALRDETQEDEREVLARESEINYIPLNGDIGCMVNGAGLAMATMDLIKLEGGEPANFLDVGGGATKERVTQAFKIILSDKHVKAILVNIFGGIVRCDLIAEGIMQAISEVHIKVPVVVRLEGNRAAEAAELLSKSKMNIIAAKTFLDAAKEVVKAARSTKGK
jgi:succinyl-CoA synthetase beta subunit